MKLIVVLALALGAGLVAQNPPPAGSGTQPQQPQGQRGGGGGGRGRGVQVMTLETTAWSTGGRIPLKYTQAGAEVSPPLAWRGAPDTTVSYALVVHDISAATGDGFSDVLHWLVWNIPKTTTSLPEGVPQGPQLADGSRQISVSGPYYRGPGAPSTGPDHHYVFELYALDTTIDVPAVGASPADTRAAIQAAMATHVRGKAVLTGLFKR